ncbi:MAG: integral rane sensor signal transduction histidine kinase [Anaerocolumna sp.]|jgi:signal transduction histidine kinase|nr:integral rane sensor signal transduction histidine kinase [Anaerocolumna sp.]
MDKKKKARPWNRLFFKVYLNYAVVLTILGVLIGIIFLKLNEDMISDSYRENMTMQATKISNIIISAITKDDHSSYAENIKMLEVFKETMPDIYTISNPTAKNPMKEEYENFFWDLTLPEDFVKVVNNAFSGKEDYRIGYYEAFGGTKAILGLPITVDDEAIGAIVVVAQIKEQEVIIQNSMYVIFMSVGISLFISSIVAIIFAKGISTPIASMGNTAIKLAEGKYESKTQIHRQDEIGELANTIDILADKLSENEVERLGREQARVDFFANVSHELRTPITVIRAYMESLVDGVITGEEKTKQYYAKILGECKGMERLVGDLLTLSKMQNPDFSVEKEPVDILQIMEDLTRSFHALSDEKNIKVEIKKTHSYYMMMGDYDRLKQMFLVILDNAIKFSNENSCVHIILSKEDKLKISIKDEGIGIAPNELSNIFDKFYKSKLKQNVQGSGLGLAIAKQIALKHEGEINVYSEQGIGTEFVFMFQCLENYVEELNI